MTPEYAEFLASKAVRAKMRGLAKVPVLAPHLFPFQNQSVDFALRAGSAALFLDTGLGKTECQLEWCQNAIEAINAKALILTPLAVAAQTKRRAERWGYEARIIRQQSEAKAGINICNYDRLDKLDPSQFGVVSMDEASILKNFTGKTTQALIAAFKGCPFKLAATATPAPNSHMELGNYTEFLEVMAANEMLSRFFINDASTASQEWRLKGHAERSFWDWMSSWARMGEKPSDITGELADDEGFILPPFEVIRHRARDSKINHEFASLFGLPAMSATSMHQVKRQTSEARAETAGAIMADEPKEPWVIWVDTDYESQAAANEIKSAVEIRGSMTIERKEEILEAFSTGQIKHLIGKPSMMFGLDWPHCARQTFLGRSFSYETWYQAVRRCWRFGQQRRVIVHLIVAEGESEIGRVIDRKAGDHAKMKNAMRDAMRRANGQASERLVSYQHYEIERLPSWMVQKQRNGV